MRASRYPTDELPFINMTPMVDVMLCLLVFFMAATRLYDWDEDQFRVKLPEVAVAAPLTTAPRDLVLQIRRPGQVAIGPKSFDLEALTAHLQEAQGRYPAQGVVLRADAALPYQALADVLSACEAAHIRNIRLPVRPREAGPAAGSAP
jgi:biopolymer transport protein ExbD